jgi:hypothetical protein
MRVLDEEEAAYWSKEGPEALRAEWQRRKKEAKARQGPRHEEFSRLEVKYWRRQPEGPPELFGS